MNKSNPHGHKSMVKQFNNSNTLLVLASYPDYEAGKRGKDTLNAMAFHSEHILKHMGKTRKIMVLAEEDEGKKTTMIGKNMVINRTWKKGSLLSFIKLAFFIRKLNHINSILIQFEFHVFGGTLANLYLLVLMLYLRLIGKKITFECHQVILNIRLLQKHINITNPFLQVFYNISLRIYYLILGLLANNIIVFEEELKRRLSRYVWDNKIYTLSLFVEKKQTINMKIARTEVNKNLEFKTHKVKHGEFVLLVFGFINGYKGIDWIIEKLKNEGKKNIRLLVVGGKNPYLSGTPAYEKFYTAIISSLKKYKNMSYVNFVPEKDIPIYYSAADAAVIPYEVFMSASGPFSQGLSHAKPVLLSEHLSRYTNSPDIQLAMRNSGIRERDFIFKYTKKDFLQLVGKTQKDEAVNKALQRFSKMLAEQRSINEIAKREDAILFPTRFVTHQSIIPNAVSTI